MHGRLQPRPEGPPGLRRSGPAHLGAGAGIEQWQLEMSDYYLFSMDNKSSLYHQVAVSATLDSIKCLKPQTKLRSFLHNINAAAEGSLQQHSNRLNSERFKPIESSRYALNHNVSTSIRLKNYSINQSQLPALRESRHSRLKQSLNQDVIISKDQFYKRAGGASQNAQLKMVHRK